MGGSTCMTLSPYHRELVSHKQLKFIIRPRELSDMFGGGARKHVQSLSCTLSARLRLRFGLHHKPRQAKAKQAETQPPAQAATAVPESLAGHLVVAVVADE
jgi:hypothetical protein